MRAILISFGVMVVCLLFVLVAQVSQPRGEAIAAERATAPIAAEPTTPAQVAQLPIPAPNMDDTSPASSPDVVTTDSGLQYVEIEAGTGATPQAGQTVTVHYTGTLEDGTKFDSSRDRNRPFSFRLGQGQVIQGWDEGLSTMKVGGRRQLIIPPDLGYGARGVGPIPPNSTLIFDVELLSIS